jgi:hypothetical protein
VSHLFNKRMESNAFGIVIIVTLSAPRRDPRGSGQLLGDPGP